MTTLQVRQVIQIITNRRTSCRVLKILLLEYTSQCGRRDMSNVTFSPTRLHQVIALYDANRHLDHYNSVQT